MLTVILAVVVLQLIVAVADLLIDVRQIKPVKQRQQVRDAASAAVVASESRFRDSKNASFDKARFAREYLMSLFPKLSAARCDAEIEAAVTRMVK